MADKVRLVEMTTNAVCKASFYRISFNKVNVTRKNTQDLKEIKLREESK